MSVGSLVLRGCSAHGRDRGLGRYERDVRALVSVLQSEGSLIVQPDGSRRAWRHALDLEAATYRFRHEVTSVLDVIPLDMPAAYTRWGLRTRMAFGRAMRSAAIITISEYSAQRMLSLYPRALGRVHVVPVPVERGSRWPDAPGNYVLAMADFRSPDIRKRTHWIAQLGQVLQTANIELKVVVRGEPPRQLIDVGPVLLRDVSDVKLHALMRECLVFFYPSAYEGQGLPPLEAMAAGAPVIAFDNTSMTEFLPHYFRLPDPHPWNQKRSLFPEMPRASVDAVMDRILQYRVVDPASWRDQVRVPLMRLSFSSVLDKFREAYRSIGVIE